MAYHLYRHFNKDDDLLYIGVSLSALHRLGQHKEHSHWFNSISKVTIENFETREASLFAETFAIQSEKPRYNIQKTAPVFQSVGGKLRLVAAEESGKTLTRQVTFKPMYNIPAAAECLGLPTSAIRRLIAQKKLGCFNLGEPGKPAKLHITGWQIIDFLESSVMANALSGGQSPESVNISVDNAVRHRPST